MKFSGAHVPTKCSGVRAFRGGEENYGSPCTNQNNPTTKPFSLSDAQIGEFLFDFLKIKPSTCLELDLNTGRYDSRELLLRSGTDLTGIINNGAPHIFRRVPIGIPNKELLHLCKLHGTLVDGKVNRETIRLGSNFRYTISSSTRWVDVKIHPGQSFKNFYWFSGPGQGEIGRKETVLHLNQPRQCSWCLKHPPTSPHTQESLYATNTSAPYDLY